MTNTVNFDPFCQIIQESERFRLKGGKIIKEDSSHKDKASWISRLFTRRQYRHQPLLNKMNSIYKNAVKNNTPSTEAYIQNYETMIRRAEVHNQRYENSCLFFFFKVDLKVHKVALSEMKISQSPLPVNTSAWWGEGTADEEVILMQEFGELGCPFAVSLLTLINSHLAFDKEDYNTPKNLQALLKTIGLVTVQDFMEKGLTSREKFTAYLRANQESFTRLILNNHSTLIHHN